MENNGIKKALKFISVLAFWLAVWEIASLLVRDELKLFLPSPVLVFEKWFEVSFTKDYLVCSGATLLRIFAGFVFGSLAGFILAIATTSSNIINSVISPAMRVIRAVPVVSFIILAFLFFKADKLPVFISFLMVMPLMWQAVNDGIRATDRKLDEMCRVYGIGRWKSLFRVKLPQCTNEIITGLVSALGFAWKSGVAAEVLCASDVSIGHKIYSAKAALNFDEVYAATLTVVLLSLVIEILLKYLCRKHLIKEAKSND